MTDITPLVGLAGSAIAIFSVGFAKFNVSGEQRDVVPAGSGALASVGSIHGILTAAHVLDELPDHGEVGLIRFASSRAIQTLTIEMSLADKLAIHGHASEVDGPDIGFLRLSSNQVTTLNTTNVFFNLSKREGPVLDNKHPSDEYFEGVSGIIAEWTTDLPPEAGFDRLRGFRGLFGVGCVTTTRECNGYDLWISRPNVMKIPKLPGITRVGVGVRCGASTSQKIQMASHRYRTRGYGELHFISPS